MAQVLLVGIGGFLGSVVRFLLGGFLPLPTLMINLIGSFQIGVAITLVPRTNASFYLLIPGVLGGFTTYSAFSSEVLSLIEKQQYGQAGLYILASVMGGVVLCYLGSVSVRT